MQELPAADWIFFTSKNAVRFFFQLGYECQDYKVACVGEGTYKVLAKFCNHIDFVGKNVDVSEVAKAFKTIVGEGSCIFPISNISKETIQQFFEDKSKVHNLVVYRTSEKVDFEIPHCDVLAFTSPSNARAYFKKRNLLPNQSVVAIGPSTKTQLEALGIKTVCQSKQMGEIGLIDAIYNCAN